MRYETAMNYFENPRVGGSNPPPGTTLIKSSRIFAAFVGRNAPKTALVLSKKDKNR